METEIIGYDNQWELMQDLFIWLDFRLYFYYINHQWLGPSSELKNTLGLTISREEFEHLLTKASLTGLEERLDEESLRELQNISKKIAIRLDATEASVSFPLLRLCEQFHLDAFEANCVIVAYALVLNPKYEKLLAYLQDDITRKCLSISLAVQLFLPADATVEQYLSRFTGKSRFTSLFESESLRQGDCILRPVIVEYLSKGTISPQPWLEIFHGATQSPDCPLVVQKTMAQQLDQMMQSAPTCMVCLSGGAGSGKRFQLRHLMAREKKSIVFADLHGEEWETHAEDAALTALLLDAYLCLYHLDRKTENSDELLTAPQEMADVIDTLPTDKPHIFLLSRLPIQINFSHMTLDFSLPALTEAERLILFQANLQEFSLAPDVTAEELAAKFHFSPRQIAGSCQQAAGCASMFSDGIVRREQLHATCYQQAVHKLGKLAQRVPAAYTWDDIVLPQEQKQLLQQACWHIRYRYLVYHTWGFDQKVKYGRGLSILLAGAPGTGKTMCAQVIAKQLMMELYKINISQVVSKYIGETEKNLQAVFNEAKNADSILFFDECDALFGKRSAVKDSHDRNANIEVAHLLQQIEAFDGVCILATNLIGNIDEAFMRRITYVVRFPFPDAAMRRAIYQRMLPPAAPVADDIDWAFLSEKFPLSGGHIKNIVLSAAFIAAGTGRPISMRELLRAGVEELKKNGIVVVREELREYADLLEEENRE